MDLSTCKSIINTLYFRKTVKKKSSNFQSNKMSNKQSKTLECSECVSISSNICLCSSANIYKSLKKNSQEKHPSTMLPVTAWFVHQGELCNFPVRNN